MKNELSHHSAGLVLDEDFLGRVAALTGREPDAADFMTLLEAGLTAMETMAAQSPQDCGDSNCVGCRTGRGEQPAATVAAEFNAVRDLVVQSIEEREAGKESDSEVTITVSESSLIFAAWLDRLIMQRSSGGLRIAGSDIDVNCPADRKGAERFLAHLLGQALERELAIFADGRHPLLFSPCADEPGPTLH